MLYDFRSLGRKLLIICLAFIIVAFIVCAFALSTCLEYGDISGVAQIVLNLGFLFVILFVMVEFLTNINEWVYKISALIYAIYMTQDYKHRPIECKYIFHSYAPDTTRMIKHFYRYFIVTNPFQELR